MSTRRTIRTLDDQLDRREAARQRREAKTHERLVAREDKADQMIGELCREGRTVYYVFPAGGKYREGTRVELIQHLIRNGHA